MLACRNFFKNIIIQELDTDESETQSIVESKVNLDVLNRVIFGESVNAQVIKMANQVSNVINSMRLKRLQKQLTAVNRLSDQMRDYSDEALQAKQLSLNNV